MVNLLDGLEGEDSNLVGDSLDLETQLKNPTDTRLFFCGAFEVAGPWTNSQLYFSDRSGSQQTQTLPLVRREGEGREAASMG
jgi:hypothetical protein